MGSHEFYFLAMPSAQHLWIGFWLTPQVLRCVESACSACSACSAFRCDLREFSSGAFAFSEQVHSTKAKSALATHESFQGLA
jgi:hypothetical protein